MAEDLKTTRYRNGDPIPNITDGTEWSNLTTEAYCNFNNNANNVATYGRLYNWYAVSDSRNIAPAGWHVPSDEEWQTLEDYLGGPDVAGGKMKTIGTIEEGTGLWYSPNTGATNSSGFSALPAGYRSSNGSFDHLGYFAFFWSATEDYSGLASYRILNYVGSDVSRYSNLRRSGVSVRCLRDN
jgi:uncharacterized protein (TIGR02145 family)